MGDYAEQAGETELLLALLFEAGLAATVVRPVKGKTYPSALD
jgi:hypothetical protein